MISPLTKLVIGLSFMFLLPFFLLGWANFHASKDWARQEVIKDGLPLTRDNIYSEIHLNLMEPIFVSSTMANDSFLKEWVVDGEKDETRIQRFLEDIRRKYGYFSVFFISEKSKRYYHYKGLHKIITPQDEHDQWYYNFVAKNKEYELDVDSDEASGDVLTIFINFRVEDEDGNLLGVTGVGMKMQKVSALLDETGKTYGRRIYMVDEQGVIQAHPDVALIDHANIKNTEGINTIAEQVLAIKDEASDFQYTQNGAEVLLTVRYVPELRWYLLVEQDESSALASAKLNLIRTALVGALLWVVSIVLSYFVLRRHHHRLDALARTDPLTGVPNRRLFVERFSASTELREKNNEEQSLIIMDLDGFKQVNDALGHVAGDQVLKAVVDAMRDTVREEDLLARWGGDEFIVLTNSNVAMAERMAERIRLAVITAMKAIVGEDAADPRASLSISCGVVSCANHTDLDELVHQADELLYEVKRQGGNQVFTGE